MQSREPLREKVMNAAGSDIKVNDTAEQFKTGPPSSPPASGLTIDISKSGVSDPAVDAGMDSAMDMEELWGLLGSFVDMRLVDTFALPQVVSLTCGTEADWQDFRRVQREIQLDEQVSRRVKVNIKEHSLIMQMVNVCHNGTSSAWLISENVWLSAEKMLEGSSTDPDRIGLHRQAVMVSLLRETLWIRWSYSCLKRKLETGEWGERVSWTQW
jgi:hypothetical protein